MSEVGIPQEKSPSKRLKMSDKEFSPPVEMMVNDFDDERTLDEEEAMETSEDHQAELSSLQKERDMPLDELLAMYGYNEHNNERSPSHGSEQETASVKEHGADADAHITDPLAPPASDPLMLDEEIEDDEEEEEEEEEKQPVSQLAKLYEEGCSTSSKETALSKALEEDDDEYNFFDEHPDDDDEDPKKTIMVGTDYQAWIPEGMCKYGDILPYENDDKLLWDPNNNLLTADLIETFLRKSYEMVMNGASADCLPMGSHTRDDEQALYLLLQCGYNTEEALRRTGMQTVPNPDTTAMWSEEECKNFESGLRMYGKNFYQIHLNKVKTRNVGEIVQFYYLWKKTERHDVFANKARLEKKKYSLHPGITDYMDRFLDEQEGNINPPASPNVYLMSESSKRQRNKTAAAEEISKTEKEPTTPTTTPQTVPASQNPPPTQTPPTSSAEDKT